MSNVKTIPLEFPIARGDKKITSIDLHKPNSGHLRGVSLKDCFEMGADATVTLIPRISEPKIMPQEMILFDPADLLQMSAAIANFFLPPALVAEAAKSIESQTE